MKLFLKTRNLKNLVPRDNYFGGNSAIIIASQGGQTKVKLARARHFRRENSDVDDKIRREKYTYEGQKKTERAS